jgi:hypothetical protein
VYDVGVHSRDPGFSTSDTPAEQMKKKLKGLNQKNQIDIKFNKKLDFKDLRFSNNENPVGFMNGVHIVKKHLKLFLYIQRLVVKVRIIYARSGSKHLIIPDKITDPTQKGQVKNYKTFAAMIVFLRMYIGHD